MMLAEVGTLESLTKAWYEIKHRLVSCGIDGVTIFNFKQNLENNLNNISREILSGKYKFSSLKAVPIQQKRTDGSVKIRALSVPIIRDRVVQRALLNAIQKPLANHYNLNNGVSFGYIQGLSTMDAVNRIRKLNASGYVWICKADIINFFPSVDRARLLDEMIFPKLPDRSIDSLLSSALNCEIGNKDDIAKKGKEFLEKYSGIDSGLMQGCVLSPYLSNIFLNSFDAEMIKNGFELVRYADDFIILSKDYKSALLSFESAKNTLRILDLVIDEPGTNKTVVGSSSDFEFLGIHFSNGKIFPSQKSFNKIREFFNLAPAEYTSLHSALSGISARTRSWGDCFGFTDVKYHVLNELDSALKESVRKMVARFDLRPLRGVFGEKSLKKIGIVTISEAVRRARIRNAGKAAALVKIKPRVPPRVNK